MVMQRLSKREKEMKKIDPSDFDVFNMKSSPTSQYIINKDITMNCSATLNDNNYNDNYNGDDDYSNYDDSNNDDNDNDNNGSNNPDIPLGYKLSGYFKEFGIAKN